MMNKAKRSFIRVLLAQGNSLDALGSNIPVGSLAAPSLPCWMQVNLAHDLCAAGAIKHCQLIF
jgi:hypothetical protein